jgi:hypothetical protein
MQAGFRKTPRDEDANARCEGKNMSTDYNDAYEAARMRFTYERDQRRAAFTEERAEKRAEFSAKVERMRAEYQSRLETARETFTR